MRKFRLAVIVCTLASSELLRLGQCSTIGQEDDEELFEANENLVDGQAPPLSVGIYAQSESRVDSQQRRKKRYRPRAAKSSGRTTVGEFKVNERGPPAVKLYNAALAALDHGDMAEAEILLLQARDSVPDPKGMTCALIDAQLGVLYVSQRRLKPAVSLLQKACPRLERIFTLGDEETQRCYRGMAVALRGMQQHTQAEKIEDILDMDEPDIRHQERGKYKEDAPRKPQGKGNTRKRGETLKEVNVTLLSSPKNVLATALVWFQAFTSHQLLLGSVAAVFTAIVLWILQRRGIAFLSFMDIFGHRQKRRAYSGLRRQLVQNNRSDSTLALNRKTLGILLGELKHAVLGILHALWSSVRVGASRAESRCSKEGCAGEENNVTTEKQQLRRTVEVPSSIEIRKRKRKQLKRAGKSCTSSSKNTTSKNEEALSTIGRPLKTRQSAEPIISPTSRDEPKSIASLVRNKLQKRKASRSPWRSSAEGEDGKVVKPGRKAMENHTTLSPFSVASAAADNACSSPAADIADHSCWSPVLPEQEEVISKVDQCISFSPSRSRGDSKNPVAVFTSKSVLSAAKVDLVRPDSGNMPSNGVECEGTEFSAEERLRREHEDENDLDHQRPRSESLSSSCSSGNGSLDGNNTDNSDPATDKEDEREDMMAYGKLPSSDPSNLHHAVFIKESCMSTEGKNSTTSSETNSPCSTKSKSPRRRHRDGKTEEWAFRLSGPPAFGRIVAEELGRLPRGGENACSRGPLARNLRYQRINSDSHQPSQKDNQVSQGSSRYHGGASRSRGHRANSMENDYTFSDDSLAAMSRVRTQIEYYFSEANLVKDIFLRQRMDAQGYVYASVLAQFNKVKEFSRNLSLFEVVAGLDNSPLLEVLVSRHPDGRIRQDGVPLAKVRCRKNWEQWLLPGFDPSIGPIPASQPINWYYGY